MEPHPDPVEQPETRTDSRGRIITAVVIGVILLIFVALHVAGAMSLHGG